MKQTKIPERNDILKMVKAELYEQGREDIKLEVAFVVNFDAGDPAIVNTIIDPHQPFPRWKCKQFVKSILERIKEMESGVPSDEPGKAASSIPIHSAVTVPVAL